MYTDEINYVSPAMLIQYAKDTSRPAYFLRNNQLIYKHTGGHNRGLAWQERDGHCYLYNSCTHFHQMRVSPPKTLAPLVLPSVKRDSSPPWEEWQHFPGTLEPGHFLAEDLAAVRQSLHDQRLVGKISVTHKCELRKLTYSLPTGRLVIMKDNEQGDHIAAFLHRFSLPYHGSGLPAAIGQVMEQLLKPKRKAFTLKNRQEQYHLQGGALRTLCF